MRKRVLALTWLALAVGVVYTPPAVAQVFTPTFQPPRGGGNVGVYLSDFEGGDFAIEGIFRQGGRPYDLGFRIGLADIGDVAFLVGADLRSPLALGTAPVDFAWTLGGQGLLGDVSGFGFQGGLSIGSTFPLEGFAFTPYIHPRLAIINPVGGNDETDLDVLADLGFDLAFPNLVLRFGVNLGRGSDWGIGVAFR